MLLEDIGDVQYRYAKIINAIELYSYFFFYNKNHHKAPISFLY